MTMRPALLGAILLAGLLQGDQLPAQVPFGNLCQTGLGICQISGGPVGSPCRCGNDQGRVIMSPPNWNNVCGTRFGVCMVSPAPIGSGCGCGNFPGQIIPR